MKRLQIAYFSPFNPRKSGVSDYSEELLPHLAEFADIDLVVDSYALENPQLRRLFRRRRPADFLAHRASYDIAVYQVANNLDDYGYMIPCMRQVPGVVVMHDFYVHHLILGLTLMHGDRRALEEILRPVCGRNTRRTAWQLLTGSADPYRIPMAWPLVAMSRGVITHNAYAAGLMERWTAGKPVRIIPMGVAMPELPESAAALRRRHGLEPDQFVLASVATLSQNKRVSETIEAVAALRGRYPRLRYVMVGGGMMSSGIRSLISTRGLHGIVRHTGWLSPQAYSEVMLVADAVIDLRYPSGAETSAGITRAIAAGKPLIVSAQGAFLEIPDGIAIKIPVGAERRTRLPDAIAALIDDPDRRRRMGGAARRFAESQHTLPQAARSYAEFLGQTAAENRTVAAWPSVHSGPVSRVLWAACYRAGRLGYLLRTYGFSKTLQRLRGQPGAGARRALGSSTL